MSVPPPEVAPSILAADFSRLADEIAAVASQSGRIHIDVMDGHFVPNLSMGPGVVASLRPVTDLPLEVHLMVEEPDKFVDPFIDAGANRLIFHVEAVSDPRPLLDRIRKSGVSPGLAFNPGTPFDASEAFLAQIDLLLLMTVNPGFGGQNFISEVLLKVEKAYQAITEIDNLVDIEVDGGIDTRTAERARKAGANVFVAGNAIFKSADPATACASIRRAVGLEGD